MGIYRIADFIVRLNNKYSYTDRLCAPYAIGGYPQHDFSVSATLEEIAAECALSGQSEPSCESTCLYRTLCGMLIPHNTFLLHAAVVEVDGRGYAFLGESGAGKSTHLSLWLKYFPAQVVNGDKPLIRKKTMPDGTVQFWAYGTPWSGKECLQRNTSVPLAALVFLEQAKQNEIIKLDPADCVKRIFHQLLLPKSAADAVRLLELIDTFVSTTPAYRLACDISYKAAELCYSTVVQNCRLT